MVRLRLHGKSLDFYPFHSSTLPARWQSWETCKWYKQLTTTTFQTGWVLLVKSHGKLLALKLLTGVNEVSRTGSRTMLNKANITMTTMKSAARTPRKMIIQFFSPLKLEVEWDSIPVIRKRYTDRKCAFQSSLPKKISHELNGLKAFVFRFVISAASKPLAAELRSHLAPVKSYLSYRFIPLALIVSTTFNIKNIRREIKSIHESVAAKIVLRGESISTFREAEKKPMANRNKLLRIEEIIRRNYGEHTSYFWQGEEEIPKAIKARVQVPVERAVDWWASVTASRKATHIATWWINVTRYTGRLT